MSCPTCGLPEPSGTCAECGTRIPKRRIFTETEIHQTPRDFDNAAEAHAEHLRNLEERRYK